MMRAFNVRHNLDEQSGAFSSGAADFVNFYGEKKMLSRVYMGFHLNVLCEWSTPSQDGF